MPRVNVIALLKKCAVITHNSMWLYWINWKLDRYIRIAKRNKKRYEKIGRMISRYNRIF